MARAREFAVEQPHTRFRARRRWVQRAIRKSSLGAQFCATISYYYSNFQSKLHRRPRKWRFLLKFSGAQTIKSGGRKLPFERPFPNALGSSNSQKEIALVRPAVAASAYPPATGGRIPEVFQKLCLIVAKRAARRSAVAPRCCVVPEAVPFVTEPLPSCPCVDSAVIDWLSRFVLSWALSVTMELSFLSIARRLSASSASF